MVYIGRWNVFLKLTQGFKKTLQVFANIKHKSTIVDGPRHLVDEVMWAREALEEEHPVPYEVVKKSIQNNASMAHPESLLIALCGEC